MSYEQKVKIVAFAEAGMSSREIAKRVRCNQSTVVRIIKKNLSHGSTERKKGTGRKRKTDERLDRMMMRLSLENRFKTAKEISRDLADSNLAEVSRETVGRRLREKGLWARKPAKKPFLNKKMKQSRLNWGINFKTWTSDDWRKVMFSDESKFNIFSSDGSPYVRRRPNERFEESCTLKTVKHPASVMVWGCFSYFGIGKMNFIEGPVNAEKYKKILEESLIPSMNSHLTHCRDFIFQDDSAPCHRAKSVS